MRRFLVLLSSVVALAVAAPVLTAGPAAASPTISCTNVRDENAAQCPVHSGVFTYYQAYVSQTTDALGPRANIRMQILARMGSTAVIIEGIWVVYISGPRTYLKTEFAAVDGAGHGRNGAWNYNGNYNPDVATASGDITRYPGVSPSAPIGLVRGSKGAPYFHLTLSLVNAGDRSPLNAEPLYVSFT